MERKVDGRQISSNVDVKLVVKRKPNEKVMLSIYQSIRIFTVTCGHKTQEQDTSDQNEFSPTGEELRHLEAAWSRVKKQTAEVLQHLIVDQNELFLFH